MSNPIKQKGVGFSAPVVPIKTKDHRNDLAKARDAFMESKEGERCLNQSILKSPDQAVYLKNRIESAFLAGVKWGQKNPQRVQINS